MLTYASDLTSMTQGRGTYGMEYSHYDIVPQPIAEKIIAAHRPSAEAEEEE
jgi:elongation factor G